MRVVAFSILASTIFSCSWAISLRTRDDAGNVLMWKSQKHALKLKNPAQLRSVWVDTVLDDAILLTQSGTTAMKRSIEVAGDQPDPAAKEYEAVMSLMCFTFGGDVGGNQCVHWGYVGGSCAGKGAGVTTGDDCADDAGWPDLLAQGINYSRATDTRLSGQSMNQAFWESLGDSSAGGDPHVVNLQGEKFDILKAGPRVMLRYPKEEGSEEALVVVAHVVRADSRWCENTFIEQVDVRGSMLGTRARFTMGRLRSPRPFRVVLGGRTLGLRELAKEQVALPTAGSFLTSEGSTIALKLDQVSVRVKLAMHSHFQFLNLDVSGLGNLPGDVGGLLGIDDHSEEAQENCQWKTHKPKLAEAAEEGDHLYSRMSASP